MLKPSIPANETSRIASLKKLNILDTAPEDKYDRLTQFVSQLFGVPIALFSIVDSKRTWYKSRIGLNAKESHRNDSFCAHAILQEESFVVQDTLKDKRFAENPFVLNKPDIRFYAAQPIRSPEGFNIGSLCLIDNKPREFNLASQRQLKQIAAIVELELAARNGKAYCLESQLLNHDGFNQIATIGQKICRDADIPLAVMYFYVKGLAGLKDSKPDSYTTIIKIIVDSLKLSSTGSDVIARYEESGFVGLFSNCSMDSLTSTARQITNLVNNNLHHRRISNIEVICGLAEDDGKQSLDELIFNAYMAHYCNARN
ncbi:GAF domain-containing protein [Thalassotalea montiporae]